MKKFVFAIVVGVLCSLPVQAGYLVQNATIVRIANTDSNQTKFSVLTFGGTGPCAGEVASLIRTGL
jgi:hypothetical protein